MGAAAMDVDLRQFVAMPQPLPETKGDTDDRERILMGKPTTQPLASIATAEDNDGNSSDECGAPFAKKTKTEKLDM